MSSSRAVAVVLGLLSASIPARAQEPAANDTLVLKVTSPRGTEVTFSGSIVFRDAQSEWTFTNQRTPFEIRIPRQQVEARFTADDGSALGGELLRLRGGKVEGHARGTIYRGAVTLFAASDGYGFGDRRARRGELRP